MKLTLQHSHRIKLPTNDQVEVVTPMILNNFYQFY